MKQIILVLLLFTVFAAFADTRVNGYYRSNGTYVQPYHKSSNNGNFYDNYSTKGNTNPYTGQPGYKTQNNTLGGSQYNNYGNTGSNNRGW